MLMNDLLNTELFNLLTEHSQQVSNTEMKNAYEAFEKQVRILNQSENDYSVIFRLLSSTRVELKVLQTDVLNEQGGKCA